MKRLATLLTLLVALTVARAQSYIVNLDAAQAGGGGRTGSGSGTLTVHDGLQLDYSITFSGLSGTVNNQHIHGPALPGANAGVLVPFSAPVGNLLSGANVPITQTVLDHMNNGLTYVNIHTTTFGGGEIRGQITLVPEPTTLAFLGLGLVGFAAARRRK
jgi:hypothetical protein